MRILWLTNIPSPYRVDFFNELGKWCDLSVVFERAGAADRDQSWLDFRAENFRAIALHGWNYSVDKSVCLGVVKQLRRSDYDAVVITNFATATGMLAIAYLKAARRPYYIESDGGFASEPGTRLRLKRMVIRGARGYFSTSSAHDEYYIQSGAKADRLIRYPFTSVRASDIPENPPTSEERLVARRELSISEPRMVLGVGQFIRRKGFDLLIRAAASLPRDVAVCIVGGDPLSEYTRLVANLGISNVYFAGFKTRPELQIYYKAADLFVLPTREDIWGLVVNEALAQGVPVVTSDRCGAGLQMVANGGCGRLVASESVDELSRAIVDLLSDPEPLEAMRRTALAVSRRCTIEDMVTAHTAVLLGHPGEKL